MIKRIKDGILTHKSDLIKKIKLQFKSEIKHTRDYRTSGAPGEDSIRIKDDGVRINEKEQFKYISAVGMMLILVECSRPNISNAAR